jgi:hypothetical protein
MALIPGLPNWLWVSAFWTVYIAWRYAKLWADRYDWRDVFKQPRDRFLVDVVSETIDDGVAMFDPKKREELRARRREQGVTSGGLRAIFESNRDTPVTSTRRTGAAPVMRDDEALLILAEGKGSHFDPDVVDAFLEIGDEVRRIAALFRDTDEELAEKAAALERLAREATPSGAPARTGN